MNHDTNWAIYAFITLFFCQACSASMEDALSGDYGYSEDDTDLNPDSAGWNDNFFPPNRGEDSTSIGLSLINPEAASCTAENAARYALSSTGNSMAGPALVREAILGGTLPLGPIRDDEFLNYYNAGYPINKTPSPLISINAIPLESAVSGEKQVKLRLAVVAPESTGDERLPLNLTLAVDTSASMTGSGIARAKAACVALVKNLKSGDILSILTWNSDTDLLLDAALFDSGSGDQMEIECNRLTVSTDKGTDLYKGLTAAYESAQRNATADRLNRVLFCSDGGAIASVTDRELIESYAERAEEANIYLSTFGSAASAAQYNENLMRMFADAGRGVHLYADSNEEAARLILERYFPALKPFATEVTLQISVPVGFQVLEGASSAGEMDEVDSNYHLSAGNTLFFHEILSYCDDPPPDSQSKLTFSIAYTPTNNPNINYVSADSAVEQDGSKSDDPFQMKIEAVVVYTEALRGILTLDAQNAIQQIDIASTVLSDTASAIGQDRDLDEMLNLLSKSKKLLM